MADNLQQAYAGARRPDLAAVEAARIVAGTHNLVSGLVLGRQRVSGRPGQVQR